MAKAAALLFVECLRHIRCRPFQHEAHKHTAVNFVAFEEEGDEKSGLAQLLIGVHFLLAAEMIQLAEGHAVPDSAMQVALLARLSDLRLFIGELSFELVLDLVGSPR